MEHGRGRRKGGSMAETTAIVIGPPTPEERRRIVAREAARTAVRTDPAVMRMEDAITREVLRAMKRPKKLGPTPRG